MSGVSVATVPIMEDEALGQMWDQPDQADHSYPTLEEPLHIQVGNHIIVIDVEDPTEEPILTVHLYHENFEEPIASSNSQGEPHLAWEPYRPGREESS